MWFALRDLSITTPGHKYLPGVNAFLNGEEGIGEGIGDLLTVYVQQQCAGFLQRFPSEEAYRAASQEKSRQESVQSRQETVQSRQASKLSSGEDFVLITHDDVKSYQGPIKRK